MRRSLIMDVTARLVFHSALVFSVYLLLAGHNQPGGGFAGGLVGGAALAIHYVAGGIDEMRSVVPLRPWLVLGGGLALATGVAIAPVLVGGAVLESGAVEVDLGPLGPIKATSTLVFDTGVYAVVVGLVLMVFEAFGEEPEPEETTGAPAR